MTNIEQIEQYAAECEMQSPHDLREREIECPHELAERAAERRFVEILNQPVAITSETGTLPAPGHFVRALDLEVGHEF